MLASSSHQPIPCTAGNLPGSDLLRPRSRMFSAILRQKTLQHLNITEHCSCPDQTTNPQVSYVDAKTVH
jgi:hypothetical protein